MEAIIGIVSLGVILYIFYDTIMYMSPEDYMGEAINARALSNIPHTKVGSIIVRHKRVVAWGYNHYILPRTKAVDRYKYPTAKEGVYILHAVADAIIDSRGRTRGATIYTTQYPCNECAKLIARAGIKRVVYKDNPYYDSPSVKAASSILRLSGIIVDRLSL